VPHYFFTGNHIDQLHFAGMDVFVMISKYIIEPGGVAFNLFRPPGAGIDDGIEYFVRRLV
jgi:hypothetical protein